MWGPVPDSHQQIQVQAPFGAVMIHPAEPGVYGSGHGPRTARPMLRRWGWIGGLGVLFFVGALFILLTLGEDVGRGGVVVGLMSALLPLMIVVPSVLWLDRFEAEPTRYLVTAFLWGACVATAVAMIVNSTSTGIIAENVGERQASITGAVVIAPFVEETLKGLGVLLLLIMRRREFDGIIDGIVYAALCAAGFAFAENILYFGRAYAEGGTGGVVGLVVLRGLLSPFAHPLFTGFTGIGLGVFASRRGPFRYFAPVLGYLMAMTLHGLWNLAAVSIRGGFLLGYLFLQLPIFVGMIIFAVWMRRREARVVCDHLAGYIGHGWFTGPEIAMLGDMSQRRRAREWASRRGGYQAAADMQRLQDQATELALLRQRISRGTGPEDAAAVEQALLEEISWLRQRLYSLG
ncbi:hypothetical protein KEM60_02763 [Austwickia sp. TVS 96-490-7B]|nr:hypothetical protein [Austwickia sp. TVS 96-490-7B]